MTEYLNSSMSLNEMAAIVHQLNAIWWHDKDGNRLERNKGEMLCLMHSELSEGYKGYINGLMDDHLPQFEMWLVEDADTFIRGLDYAGGHNIDLSDQFVAPSRSPNMIDYYVEGHFRISEIMEAERKGKKEKLPGLFVDFLGLITERLSSGYLTRALYHTTYETFIAVVNAKLAYNAKRADHTYEARARADGKKW